MAFSQEVLDLIQHGGGVVAELPARRPGHRRYISVGKRLPPDPGTPEEASRRKKYEYFVYEIDAARTDEDAQSEDLLDREGGSAETLEELESMVLRYVALDALVGHRKLRTPWW